MFFFPEIIIIIALFFLHCENKTSPQWGLGRCFISCVAFCSYPGLDIGQERPNSKFSVNPAL